jgi:hypothetical protein
MATRTTIVLEDDLEGGPADETVQFRFGTTDYEIDLNATNASSFRTQLAPFIDHARPAGREQAPGTDEEALAQIADVCRWYAAGGPPTAQRQAAALAELAHITGGRTDLLARYAGQSLAWHDTGPDNTVLERAAQLCITAGADMDLIERWRRVSRPHRVTTNRPESSAMNRHGR